MRFSVLADFSPCSYTCMFLKRLFVAIQIASNTPKWQVVFFLLCKMLSHLKALFPAFRIQSCPVGQPDRKHTHATFTSVEDSSLAG
jgi:hypothetical protein